MLPALYRLTRQSGNHRFENLQTLPRLGAAQVQRRQEPQHLRARRDEQEAGIVEQIRAVCRRRMR